MRKLIINSVKLLMILGMMGSLVLMTLGYQAYQKEVKKISIEKKVSEIRSNENFVAIEDISPWFLEAIVATEDRRFYKHGAIDELSILRATAKNLIEGELVQGGSTITQQLAKNIYFTSEKTFTRKIGEIFVAYELEKAYTKEDILELYVNVICYGDENTGIKAASQNYFHKEASELSFDEATLLAGLPQAPSRYALSENYELAKQRQKQVIKAMNRSVKEESQEVVLYK